MMDMASKTNGRVRIPIWAKPPAGGFSFATFDKNARAFFERYGRFMTLLAAFIVFGTFIAKEALRDRAKDLLADIRAAEGAYERRAQYDSLRTTMFVMEEDRNRPVSPQGGRGPVLTVAQLRENLRAELGAQVNFGPEINNAVSLSAALPANEEISKAIFAASEAYQKWETIAPRFNTPEFLSPQAKNNPATDDYKKMAAALVDAEVNARNEASTMTTKVLRYAYEQEEKRENQSKLFGTVSIILYSLGWSLGLLTKLYEPAGSKSKAEAVGQSE